VVAKRRGAARLARAQKRLGPRRRLLSAARKRRSRPQGKRRRDGARRRAIVHHGHRRRRRLRLLVRMPRNSPPGQTAHRAMRARPALCAGTMTFVLLFAGQAAAQDPPVEVTVRGKNPPPPAASTMTQSEVEQLPGAFGDPFRAVEILPGVTPVASGIPYFFVRGAPPGNVGYFLDGVRVPLLYHIGLGPSVIHPALVESVELYPGGYPAEFGRFTGGIVAADPKPASALFHGDATLRLLDAGALVEAPFAEGRGRALASGRYSYTGLLLSLISPTTELSYWDYQSRVVYDLGADDRLTLFGFGSYDFTGEKSG